MQEFTGYDYLLMDVAAHSPFGLDKEVYAERIDWTECHDTQLEAHVENYEWKAKPLYLKAVQALRKAQQGIATGHMMGFDAVCSGMQLMSVMAGCIKGATATGLVDTNRRPDAYTDVTAAMSDILGFHFENERQKAKDSTMTALYASKAEPEKIYGKDTPELAAFYGSLEEVCPGAMRLLQALLDSWQDWEKVQQWRMPDGGLARNRVMQDVETRIEIDELNHHTFTYQFKENEGEERGLKNVANVIHSVDAWVLRSVIRRCSYDMELLESALDEIACELMTRILEPGHIGDADYTPKVAYYMEQYYRSGLTDVVILDHLTVGDIQNMPTEYLQKLQAILKTMEAHRTFDVITVHDDFKCHPNNMNHLRKHYRNILAELADVNLMEDILRQITGTEGVLTKMSDNLSKFIMQSEYSLC